jgi:hypothetical protein
MGYTYSSQLFGAVPLGPVVDLHIAVAARRFGRTARLLDHLVGQFLQRLGVQFGLDELSLLTLAAFIALENIGQKQVKAGVT